MANTITVTVGQESIQVAPMVLTITNEEEVVWASGSSARFTIAFEAPEGSPFTESELDYETATTPQQPLPSTVGSFKYTVYAEADPSVMLDPVIVIEEPISGPHEKP